MDNTEKRYPMIIFTEHPTGMGPNVRGQKDDLFHYLSYAWSKIELIDEQTTAITLYEFQGQPVYNGITEWMKLYASGPDGKHLGATYRARAYYIEVDPTGVQVRDSILLGDMIPFSVEDINPEGSPTECLQLKVTLRHYRHIRGDEVTLLAEEELKEMRQVIDFNANKPITKDFIHYNPLLRRDFNVKVPESSAE